MEESKSVSAANQKFPIHSILFQGKIVLVHLLFLLSNHLDVLHPLNQLLLQEGLLRRMSASFATEPYVIVVRAKTISVNVAIRLVVAVAVLVVYVTRILDGDEHDERHVQAVLRRTVHSCIISIMIPFRYRLSLFSCYFVYSLLY